MPERDAAGWITRSRDRHVDAASGAVDYARTLDYSYDRRGLMTQWASAGRGRRLERSFYDSGAIRSRTAVRVNPDGSHDDHVYRYGSDPAGELTALVDERPPGPDSRRTTLIERDLDGRVVDVNESWDGGRDTRYAYGHGLIDVVRVDGRFSAGSYVGGRSLDFAYDDNGWVTRVDARDVGAGGSPVTTRFGYWPSGELASQTNPSGAVSERYYTPLADLAAKRERRAANNGSDLDRYAYDIAGNRTRDERGTYTFNARDQLASWHHDGAGTQSDPDEDVTYVPTGSGTLRQITTESNFIPGGLGGLLPLRRRTTETRAYDGELLRSTRTQGSVAVVGLPILPTPIRGSRAIDHDVFGSVITDAVTDEIANTTKTTRYVFDEFERLVATRIPDTSKPTAAFCYDALDRRDRKITGLSTDTSASTQRAACQTKPTDAHARDYSYLGLEDSVTRQRSDTGAVQTFDYTPAGQRLGIHAHQANDPTKPVRYRPYRLDANGDVTGLQDPTTGAVNATDAYRTDPYGQPLDPDSQLSVEAQVNPYRYQNQNTDPDAGGMISIGARVYQPALQQWLTPDRYQDPNADLTLQTNPLTTGRYTFLAANPTNRVELDGHDHYDSFQEYEGGRANDAGQGANCHTCGHELAKRPANLSTGSYVVSHGGTYHTTTGVTVSQQGAYISPEKYRPSENAVEIGGPVAMSPNLHPNDAQKAAGMHCLTPSTQGGCAIYKQDTPEETAEGFAFAASFIPIPAIKGLQVAVRLARAAKATRTAARTATTTTKEIRPASSAVSGKLLKRELASEAQVAEPGSPIFGAGTDRALRDAPRLARTYGGRAEDWAKMGSSTYKDGGGLWDLFETHWYQNMRTGLRVEPKTKFPRAEDFFGGSGG